MKAIIPPVNNAKECAFYSDDSLYILKPIALDGDHNYKVTYEDEKTFGSIEFNICNSLIGLSADHPCVDAFACRILPDGTSFPLSGKNFKEAMQADVQNYKASGRLNDTKKGGLVLDYLGGT